jgi:hypothetical protein
MQAIEFTGARSGSRLAATAGYIAVIILITAASIALAMSRISDPAERQLAAYREIVVQPGDTLWDLARENSLAGADLRRAVYEIRTLNGLADAEIRPGQRLLLPAE